MEQAPRAEKNVLALRVALQTLKERCTALQRRLGAVEEENQQLRDRAAATGADYTPPATTTVTQGAGAAENFQLRLQLAEMGRQKTQLSEHIDMVSNENRKLWSHLSQMAKEQGKVLSSSPKDGGDGILMGGDGILMGGDATDEIESPRGGANQNLIRSKTFTQHSPNPHLRHKLLSSEEADDVGVELTNISLEEVALGGEAVAAAELSFTNLNLVDESGAAAAAAAGGDNANEGDFNLEAKKYIEGLQDMRREAMKQRQALNAALTVLESKTALHPCPECAQKTQKPEMADKSLETDESIGELQVNFYHNNNSQIMHNVRKHLKEDANIVLMNSSQLPATTSVHNGHKSNGDPAEAVVDVAKPARLNIIQEKIDADSMDKTCPMCGKIYTSLVTFDAFREHVEMHFIEDASDVEVSMERQFEFISHAVGDF